MNSNTLDSAPDHIKLAVELIQILEESKIDPDTALAALEIVQQDIKRQQK